MKKIIAQFRKDYPVVYQPKVRRFIGMGKIGAMVNVQPACRCFGLLGGRQAFNAQLSMPK
jgi:hypothetical protein